MTLKQISKTVATLRFSVLCLTAMLASAARAEKPNILIIIADDLGADKVGAYGAEGAPRTPQLDRLAEDGVLFRTCWGTPLCSSARASLLTGKYPFRTGVFATLMTLRPEETILPEVLSPLGYRSGLFGKWHVSSFGEELAPNLAGFDYYSGALLAALPNYYRFRKTTNGVSEWVNRYETTDVVDDATAWIEEQGESPWLCCVAFHSPHLPLHPPPPALHQVKLRGLDPRTSPVPFYNAMVEALDTETGRLLRHLGPRADKTLVIVVGDNGTTGKVIVAPRDPSQGKGTAYETGVQVPCIVSGYGVVDPGREVQDLVHLVDVFATVTDLVGADNETGIDSVSFLPQLQNRTDEIQRRTTLYTEVKTDPYHCLAAETIQHCQQAIRNDRFKVLFDQTVPAVEYYDLANDPLERLNLNGVDLPLQMQMQFTMLRWKLHATRILPQLQSILPHAESLLMELPFALR